MLCTKGRICLLHISEGERRGASASDFCAIKGTLNIPTSRMMAPVEMLWAKAVLHLASCHDIFWHAFACLPSPPCSDFNDNFFHKNTL